MGYTCTGDTVQLYMYVGGGAGMAHGWHPGRHGHGRHVGGMGGMWAACGRHGRHVGECRMDNGVSWRLLPSLCEPDGLPGLTDEFDGGFDGHAIRVGIPTVRQLCMKHLCEKI